MSDMRPEALGSETQTLDFNEVYGPDYCDVAATKMFEIYHTLGCSSIGMPSQKQATESITRLHETYGDYTSTIIPVMVLDVPKHTSVTGHDVLGRMVKDFRNSFSDERTIFAEPLERPWHLLNDDTLNTRRNLGEQPPQAFSVRGLLVDVELTRRKQRLLKERQLAGQQTFLSPLDFLAAAAALRDHPNYSNFSTVFPVLFAKDIRGLDHNRHVYSANTRAGFPHFSTVQNDIPVKAIKTLGIPN